MKQIRYIFSFLISSFGSTGMAQSNQLLSIEDQIIPHVVIYYPSNAGMDQQIYLKDLPVYYYLETWASNTSLKNSGQAKYKHFAVARPHFNDSEFAADFYIYLVNPEGSVFRLMNTLKIDDSVAIERVEERGTMTETTIIRTGLYPVVDHFLAHPDAWEKRGEVIPRKRKNKFVKVKG